MGALSNSSQTADVDEEKKQTPQEQQPVQLEGHEDPKNWSKGKKCKSATPTVSSSSNNQQGSIPGSCY